MTKRISELPAVSFFTLADLLEIVQSGVSRNVTGQQLADTIIASITIEELSGDLPLAKLVAATTERRVLGRAVGAGAGDWTELNESDLRTIIGTFGAGNRGLVPDPVTVEGKFLKDDGTFDTPVGDATSLRGVALDESFTTPNDGDVAVFRSAGNDWVLEAKPAGGTGHTIQDEGTPLTARSNLNFVGAGVTATDDSGNDATVVTIPSGVATTLDTQMVNVKDHGAVGNSSAGADETTEINAAIAAVNALTGPAILWFPWAENEYHVASTSLTTVRQGVSVWMDRRIVYSATPSAVNVWQIGSESAASEHERHRLMMRAVTGGDARYTTANFTAFYVPNLRHSTMSVKARGFNIGLSMWGVDMGSWGNTIDVIDLEQCTKGIHCGGKGTGAGGWMNSMRIVGGGPLGGNAVPTSETRIGVHFENLENGSSGNDNTIDGPVFQSGGSGTGDRIAVKSEQPNGMNILSGRFEDWDWICESEGSGDGENMTTLVYPTHERNIANSPPVRVLSGSGKIRYVPARSANEISYGGQVLAGNLLRQGTRSDAGTALDVDLDSGGDFTTGGALTIPNTAGFHCDLEVGADTHDFTHNSLTLDLSAKGFVAGEIYTVRVRASNAIRVIGPAGQFTEADFA